jgi:hypothetical protein
MLSFLTDEFMDGIAEEQDAAERAVAVPRARIRRDIHE